MFQRKLNSIKKSKAFRYSTFLLQFFQISKAASSFYKTPYYSNLYRCFTLGTKKGFRPEYAFQLGLLNPEITESEISRYISKKAMIKIQEKLNPKSWEPLTEDKSIFYRYCMEIGIHIPQLYAISFKGSPGWSFNGNVLNSLQDWIKFLQEEVPSEFVIKPAGGAYGLDIQIFNRHEYTFTDTTGDKYCVDDIYKKIFSNPIYDCFIIQERIMNHAKIIDFTGSDTLQTLRMISFINSRNQQPQILYSSLKVASGKGIVDNFERGMTGNLKAEVSEKGFLEPAVTIGQNYPGIKSLIRHPKTNLRFDELQIPYWNETCDIIKKIAIKFLPVKIVGWDVAIAPNGPVLIEGNRLFDPPNPHRVDKIVNAISENKS